MEGNKPGFLKEIAEENKKKAERPKFYKASSCKSVRNTVLTCFVL